MRENIEHYDRRQMSINYQNFKSIGLNSPFTAIMSHLAALLPGVQSMALAHQRFQWPIENRQQRTKEMSSCTPVISSKSAILCRLAQKVLQPSFGFTVLKIFAPPIKVWTKMLPDGGANMATEEHQGHLILQLPGPWASRSHQLSMHPSEQQMEVFVEFCWTLAKDPSHWEI